jgi:hypothetical protein
LSLPLGQILRVLCIVARTNPQLREPCITVARPSLRRDSALGHAFAHAGVY